MNNIIEKSRFHLLFREYTTLYWASLHYQKMIGCCPVVCRLDVGGAFFIDSIFLLQINSRSALWNKKDLLEPRRIALKWRFPFLNMKRHQPPFITTTWREGYGPTTISNVLGCRVDPLIEKKHRIRRVQLGHQNVLVFLYIIYTIICKLQCSLISGDWSD